MPDIKVLEYNHQTAGIMRKMRDFTPKTDLSLSRNKHSYSSDSDFQEQSYYENYNASVYDLPGYLGCELVDIEEDGQTSKHLRIYNTLHTYEDSDEVAGYIEGISTTIYHEINKTSLRIPSSFGFRNILHCYLHVYYENEIKTSFLFSNNIPFGGERTWNMPFASIVDNEGEITLYKRFVPGANIVISGRWV